VRVLHVVTLVSPTGAFGGPTRVAANQARVLAARGHDVTIVAGYDGDGTRPDEVDGVPARLFPVRRAFPAPGFSGLAAPAMVRWARSALAGYDVVHVHLGRDLVTLPMAALARRRRIPYVVQTHGMVVPSGNPLAPVLDGLLTRRVLQDATAVLHLTPLERDGLTAVAGPGLRLEHLGNGVPVVDDLPPQPTHVEALFLSRLHSRKRPLVFVEAAQQLLDEGVDATFVLVGPDEGEGPAVRSAIAAVGRPDRLRWDGPVRPEDAVGRIGAASLFVLPSVDEPYPMAAIEALSVGRPIVVTTSCGIADVLAAHGGGVVVDETVDGLVAGMRTLLIDSEARRATGDRAAIVAREQFGMERVADRLEAIYSGS
jgi:glycosyltransferase involved in cell wall biosynthesis